MSIVLTPIAAIICDDIREEKNGKLIIIGVYQDNIRIGVGNDHKIPFKAWILFSFSEPGNAEIEIEVLGPGEGAIFKMKVEATMEGEGDNSSITVPIPIMPENGDLEIYFRNKSDEERVLIKSIPVEVVDD